MPRRHVPWITGAVLALGVPGLLVGAWAFLAHGPGVRSLQLEERDVARRMAGALEDELQRSLRDLSHEPRPGDVVRLPLDAQGRPSGPFLFDVSKKSTSASTLASDPMFALGMRYELEGEPANAARILEKLYQDRDGAVPDAAVLSLARSLAATGRSENARELLAQHEPMDGERDLPWVLLARLTAVKLAEATSKDELAQALRREMLSGQVPVPASAVEPILDFLAPVKTPQDLVREVPLRAAARAFARLRRDPDALARGPLEAGAYVVSPSPTEALVIPLPTLQRLADAAASVARREVPYLQARPVQEPSSASALWTFRPLEGAGAWEIVAGDELPSERQARLARFLLFLAPLAFLAGAWLVFRSVRRELQLARMKGEFIDVVSHELRTPLTALSMKSEMLVSGRIPPERRESYLRGLDGEVRKLSALVHRVLDFERLSEGRKALRLETVRAREIVARSIRAARPAFEMAEQRLRIEMPRPAPCLRVDAEVVVRALRNLLENAAKYAPEDSEVLLRGEVQGGLFCVSVADRGPGIPIDERRSIWEPFQRGHGRTDQGVVGSGLGLALVREAARAHRGRASVSDREGGGAVFELFLPTDSEGAA